MNQKNVSQIRTTKCARKPAGPEAAPSETASPRRAASAEREESLGEQAQPSLDAEQALAARTADWTTHELGAVEPAKVAQALATEPDAPLAAGILWAIADDLDALVTIAANGAAVDADMLQRLVNRCRIAAELVDRKEATR